MGVFGNTFGHTLGDQQLKLFNRYYVSNTGNDLSDGKTPATAWRTVSKVNSSIFIAGDQIRFKRGDTWMEELLFSSNGSISNPITISSYGVGTKPIFTSPIATPTWTNNSGVYSATNFLHDQYSILWEDNIAYPMATSNLCTDGIWFTTWNGSTIYYKPTSGTPNDHIINYSKKNYDTNNFYQSGINVSDKSNIIIDGLQFINLGGGIITWDSGVGTNNITIKNCDFKFCYSPIFFMPDVGNNTGSVISNNYFYRCYSAIRLYTNSATLKAPHTTGEHLYHGGHINCVVSNNEMEECGTVNGIIHWSYGSDNEAIGFQNIENSNVYSNYIHGGYQTGLIIYNLDYRESKNNIFRNNIIENNNKDGINITGASLNTGFNNNYFYNNIFINSVYADNVISIRQGTSPYQYNYIYNNTCISTNPLIKIIGNLSVYFSIKNNIVYGTTINYFKCDGNPTNLILDYNMYYTSGSSVFRLNASNKTIAQMQSLGFETHSSINNPLFVGVSDFHLQSGSPAINAGVDVGLTSDYDGNPIVGVPDIGAYEKQ